MITYYQKFCDESFEPLSEHTFYRFLNGFNPSQQKSLAWLDDMTADSLNGFKSLVSNQIITPLNSQEKARSWGIIMELVQIISNHLIKIGTFSLDNIDLTAVETKNPELTKQRKC